ncbi:L-seryl-tRNA(Ser) seleniumtransferase [Evansella caseinilytica]|uniref:L-seryl-tRNA(Sec) selenium transferase n=1 Tax=Evansella caseinilytica TaxID=1503961 RepID=A0A1H3T0B6_9BACI|nr:L-seryl-tRNA(Ser) seleniumtransferase [Evansella caseinilytica]
MTNALRQLPAVNELLQTARVTALIHGKSIPHLTIKAWIQAELLAFRKALLNEITDYLDWTRSDFSHAVIQALEKKAGLFFPYRLHRVLNGTGTILHTNLGRARLSEEAVQRVVETAKHYSTLEYDIQKESRGSRHDVIEELLTTATGGEAAMVVNNNAAAVYFILRCLGQGKEVIVSRGELIEIGGSFRISTIMEESGAQLVEVGTTNKTHPYDYANAITDNTRILMKVHTSNFKTVGFTKEVTAAELKALAETYSAKKADTQEIFVYEDLGSGSLYPFCHAGIGEEPAVKEALRYADVVSFSGDKLLGGPQAGIIAGKKQWVDILKKHPLARVLRVDKMTLAALEATLQSYVHGEKNEREIPVVRDVLLTKEQVMEKAARFLNEAEGLSGKWRLTLREDVSKVGGGTMPLVELPTAGVLLAHSDYSSEALKKALHFARTPVITRIVSGQVYIDFRTIADDEIPMLVESLTTLE